ncbi:MAG: carbon-nitrogen hydrolase family protein, partial [Chloroflexota bacterium]
MIRYVMTAQKIPGAYTAGLGEVARKHGVYLVAGMLEAHPLVAGTLYNSAVLIAPDGKLVGVYRKCHIPSEEKHYFYAGTEVGIYQTELGVVGVMVCADNA